MARQTLIAFLLYSITTSVAVAQVPFTFTQGQPANAGEVNANFNTLVLQIEQLQAQVAALQAFAGAPTTASLAATYDIFELTVDVEQTSPPNGYGVAGKSSFGTAVLNADGTGTISVSDSYRQLSFVDALTSVGNASNAGSVAVHSTTVTFNKTSEPENFAMTWSLAGGVVTITTVDGDINFVVAGGKILINGIIDFEGQNGIRILVRR